MKHRTRNPKTPTSVNPRSWTYFVFFVTFVVQSFYYLAILRCKPGPIRLP